MEAKGKVYLAGPMTGFEYFNFPAFDKERDKWINRGFDVFSPADHDRFLLGKPGNWIPSESDSTGPWKAWAIEGAPTLRVMLGADLAWIAENATDIAMLHGWENSKGARAEWSLALALGIRVHYPVYT